MIHPLFLHGEALRDAEEQCLYLGERSPVAAERFLTGLAAALRRLQRMPRLGTRLSLASLPLRGVRSWPVPGFESVRIHYRVAGGRVVVLRILHGARDLPTLPAPEEE